MRIIRLENTEQTPDADKVSFPTYRFECGECDEFFRPEDAVLQVNHYYNMHARDWVQGDSRVLCPECDKVGPPLRMAIPLADFRRVEQVYGQ
jgi:hypothetical protein